MILSAMMFALGVFVTGLLALGFSVALVRRTRRVTERRLMAAVSARRAEFEAERDELRARHAVQMHRLEREVARVLDMATAHRLDADVKDRDLLNARAELDAVREENQELHDRVAEHRDSLQEVERKHAESSAALRAARHALKLESRRRAAIEETLDQALAAADGRSADVTALQARVAALRLGAAQSPVQDGEVDGARVAVAASGDDGGAPGRVVPLPLRPRTGNPGEAPSTWEVDATADDDEAHGDEVHWIGARAAADLTAPGWRAAAEPGSAETHNIRLDDHSDSSAANTAGPDSEEKAETLFVEALAEIRALKRTAASQAGE